jgi:16S rRNA C967 or C1407 C5-methylase (RsmB/RsmF family)
MMGAAPVLLCLALRFAAPDPGSAPAPAPATEAALAQSASETPRVMPAPEAPAIDRSAARARRLHHAAARLGTGLTARRSPDDREQPLIGPVSLLAGFGTVLIDVEVPN